MHRIGIVGVLRTLEMLPTGTNDKYEAEIPAAEVDPKLDLVYLFEAMDRVGNGKIYPDLEKETPYVIVKVERGSAAGMRSVHPRGAKL